MSTWIFELANSSDLSKIAELTQARSKQFTLTLNRAGSASFTLPLDDPVSSLVEEVSTCLLIRRKLLNNTYTIVWSGYVSGISEQSPNQMTVNCVGWLQLLEKRFIKEDINYIGTDAGQIALGVLNNINSEIDDPAPDSSSEPGPSNPSFALNTTSWSVTGGTITRSTSNFHSSPASGLFAPAAAGNVLTETFNGTFIAGHTYTLTLKMSGGISGGSPTVLRFGAVTDFAESNVGLSGNISSFFDYSIIWTPLVNSSAVTLNITAANTTSLGIDTLSLRHETGTTSQSSSFITSGTAEPTILRTRSFKKFEQVLKIIQDLSDIENGYDLFVDPITRQLNIYSKQQTDRPNLNFEYKINIADVSRTVDTSRLVNRIFVLGQPNLAVAQADDFDSQATYGLFEEVVTLSDVNDQNILGAYANAEIAIRSMPLRIYTFSLMKSTNTGNVPRLYIDYKVGDKIYLTAQKGRIQERRKPVRIFSLSVTINENGVEQVSGIQTTANV